MGRTVQILMGLVLLAATGCSGDGGPGGPCAGILCSNHGTCQVDDEGRPTCDCDQGYVAQYLLCVPDTGDPCEQVDCGAHGTCVVLNGAGRCSCDDGYRSIGDGCVPESGDVCSGVDCGAHGTCVDDGGVPACQCDDGYHADGLTCVEDSSDVCEGVDCGAHGTCVDDGTGQPMCQCDDGYHADGLTCVPDSTACDGVDCGEHGTCVDDGTGQPMCECDDGYHPDGLTCVEDGGGGTFCQEACSGDPDCLIGGQDAGYSCQGGRCLGESSGCTTDPECLALFAGWTIDCTNGGGECDGMGQVCIDIGGGVGKCAVPPPGGMTCADLSMAALQMPAIDGSGDLTVCVAAGIEDAECREGVCFNPCAADADCQYYPGTPTCDTNTGVCICTQDPDCAGVANVSVCDTDTGRCICAGDADCTGANVDTCYDGICGCSVVDVCTADRSFDGTSWVCE